MLASNIFRLIGEFFTWAFTPFQKLRLSHLNWWESNIVSWMFLIVGFVLFAYWMRRSRGFQKDGTEDLPK